MHNTCMCLSGQNTVCYQYEFVYQYIHYTAVIHLQCRYISFNFAKHTKDVYAN